MFKECKDFLVLMGQYEPNPLTLIERQKFHDEELEGEGELLESIITGNRIGVADGLADLTYVVVGSGVLVGMTERSDIPDESSEMTLPEAVAWLSTLVKTLPVSRHPDSAITAILDILHRIAELQGIDLQMAFNIAHRSNMAKATDSYEDAVASVEHYGFPVTVSTVITETGTRYVLRSDTDDHPKYFRGKVLKPLSWKEPDFKPALLTH